MIRRATDRRTPTDFFHSSRGKKGWSEQEDNLLKHLVDVHGTGNWTLIAQSLPERTGKQCRERFHNHLEQGIKKGDWTEEEDRIIITLQRIIGNQWAKITKLLPGRTDNAVKNRFHATERAKLRGKLDESLLSDHAYTAHILKEAMRINNEVFELEASWASILSSSSASTTTATSVSSAYPTATATAATAEVEVEMDWQGSVGNSEWITATPLTPNGHNLSLPLAPISPLSPLVDEDEDEADGEVDGEGLMDLDIISFDENDEFYQLDDEAPGANAENKGGVCGVGCFSNFNFDWSRGAAPASPIPAQPQAQQPSEQRSYNLCGLESFGFQRAPQPQPQPQGQPQYPFPQQMYAPQTDAYYAQQLQHQQQQQQQQRAQMGGMTYFGYFR